MDASVTLILSGEALRAAVVLIEVVFEEFVELDLTIHSAFKSSIGVSRPMLGGAKGCHKAEVVIRFTG